MSQPETMGSGPVAPMQEPPGLGPQHAVTAQQQPAQPLSQKRGLIIAVLIGINLLCLAAIAAVSGTSEKEAPAHASAGSAADKNGGGESAAAAKAAEAPAREAKETGKPAKEEEREKAEPSAGAPSQEKAAAAAAGDAKGGERAVVTPPGGRPRGVLRAKPDGRADVVVNLPAGTAVEITNKVVVKAQTWYEVKTVDFDPPSSGWMHEAVVKMQ